MAATLTTASRAKGISLRTFLLLYYYVALAAVLEELQRGEMRLVPLFKECFHYIRDLTPFFIICLSL